MDHLIENYGSINNYINSIGSMGSPERLQAIANLDLGERSESAKRVLEKRCFRKDLIDKGLTFENVCLIVNKRILEQ
jgi:hypothetical protein